VSTLRFDSVSHDELARMSAVFESGAHVVLGTERDGTNGIVQLAAGIAAPRAGRVTLDDQAPHDRAVVRRRVSALCVEERLPEARTVAAAFALALSARGDTRSPQSVLDQAGLSSFATRRSATLSARELRALALAFALSHERPLLLALFEPLSALDLLAEEFVLASLSNAVNAGAIVLATANRLEDAARLGGVIGVIERGVWLGAALPELLEVALRVRTPEPRRLAARLAETPDVLAVEWGGGSELVVRGSTLESIAAKVVESARAEAIRIEALRCEAPSLDALAAERAGLAQAAYERARLDAPNKNQNQIPIFTNGRTLQ
jgi:ABC-type multidrug transport system ATPase subunit